MQGNSSYPMPAPSSAAANHRATTDIRDKGNNSSNPFNEKMNRVKEALLNISDSDQMRDAQIAAFLQFVIEAQKNPAIKDCSATSITSVIRTAALNKLSLNSNSKEAYLIPRKNELTLLIGYQAYINRAAEHGYEVDTSLMTKETLKCFKYNNVKKELIMKEEIDAASYIESMSFKKEDIAAVCVSIYSLNMPRRDILYSTADLLERAKQNIGYGKVGLGKVWSASDRQTDYGEMLKKTAVRHALKNIPCNKSLNELLHQDLNSVQQYEQKSTRSNICAPKPATASKASFKEYV